MGCGGVRCGFGCETSWNSAELYDSGIKWVEMDDTTCLAHELEFRDENRASVDIKYPRITYLIPHVT